MGRKVYIDEEECVGCGTCEELCPEIFELDEETGRAKVIEPEVEDEGCVEEAMDTCPAECIHWEEE
ncbi:MAG: ferredoxin [Deltaproteobacteria bacterium]|nr:MAG: ferredoxin [Deltaproteobacteria bacterium]